MGPGLELLTAIMRHYERIVGCELSAERLMAWHLRQTLGGALWRSEAGIPLPDHRSPGEWAADIAARFGSHGGSFAELSLSCRRPCPAGERQIRFLSGFAIDTNSHPAGAYGHDAPDSCPMDLASDMSYDAMAGTRHLSRHGTPVCPVSAIMSFPKRSRTCPWTRRCRRPSL